MSQILKTVLNFRYEVRSPESCTVLDSSGNLLLAVTPGTPAYFTADGQPVTLSSDMAVMLQANERESGNGGGGGALSAMGEPVQHLESALLEIVHATWFNNTDWESVSVAPAVWRNEVMTCYLKTSVPVSLSGVVWLYGEPVMVPGYTYVVALQQIDAATVLANLAYVVPQ